MSRQLSTDRHAQNTAKFPGLERLEPQAYNRGFSCGYAHAVALKNAPQGLATLKGRLTTAHGTGFRHGYIQGARDRREGKVK